MKVSPSRIWITESRSIRKPTRFTSSHSWLFYFTSIVNPIFAALSGIIPGRNALYVIFAIVRSTPANSTLSSFRKGEKDYIIRTSSGLE